MIARSDGEIQGIEIERLIVISKDVPAKAISALKIRGYSHAKENNIGLFVRDGSPEGLTSMTTLGSNG